MANEFESLDNIDLIENSLDHIQFELKRSNIFYFRIGREAHLVLYRSLIEALKGTANLAISGHQSKTRQRIYHLGNNPWKEIHKIEIEGCTKAWRYSNPNICNDPEIDYSSINLLTLLYTILFLYS